MASRGGTRIWWYVLAMGIAIDGLCPATDPTIYQLLSISKMGTSALSAYSALMYAAPSWLVSLGALAVLMIYRHRLRRTTRWLAAGLCALALVHSVWVTGTVVDFVRIAKGAESPWLPSLGGKTWYIVSLVRGVGVVALLLRMLHEPAVMAQDRRAVWQLRLVLWVVVFATAVATFLETTGLWQDLLARLGASGPSSQWRICEADPRYMVVVHAWSVVRATFLLLLLYGAGGFGGRGVLSPPPPGHCRVCGYDLKGITGSVCPECGTEREPSRS